MSADAIRAILHPASIAIYGASENIQKFGGRLYDLVLRHRIGSQVFPINPHHSSLRGLPCYPNLAALPAPADVAVIAVPLEAALAAVKECRENGVKAVVMITAGFAEAGPAGRARQDELLALTADGGPRILGPNCLGAINAHDGVALCSTIALYRAPMLRGAVTLISQSGAMLGSLMSMAQDRGIGFRYLVSTGNEADLTMEDFLEFAVHDPETRAVALWLEHVRRPEAFLAAAAEAAQRSKPIIALKVGRSVAGARAARSHTSALTGDDAVHDAVFRRFGITRAFSPEELIHTAAVLSVTPLPTGPRTAIWSASGGACSILADLANAYQLPLADLSSADVPTELSELYGERLDNPIDLGNMVPARRDFSPGAIRQLLAGLHQHAGVDQLLLGLSTMPNIVKNMEELVGYVASGGKPVIVYDAAGEVGADARAVLHAHGLMPVIGADLSIRAAKALADRAAFRAPNSALPSLPQSRVPPKDAEWAGPHMFGTLDEVTSKSLLANYGIPITREQLCGSLEEVVAAAGEVGYPVVLKIVSRDLPHKSDAGGVRLDLRSPEAVRDAYRAILQRVHDTAPSAAIDGVLVQEMVSGIEVIVGGIVDPQFGPVVLLGMGGLYAELLRDTTVELAPLDTDRARAMLSRVRAGALLHGLRGQPPADVEALLALIVHFSHALYALQTEVASIDLNPVIVRPAGQGAMAVDALIVAARVHLELQHDEAHSRSTLSAATLSPAGDPRLAAGGQ